MNNRLYELMNQAFIGTTDGKLSELNTVANIKKFAELIIRECAKCGSKAMYPDSDPDYVGRKIREHFGVKE